MKKNQQITVNNTDISISRTNDDYICISDIAKIDGSDTRAIDRIKNWLRNKNTIEYLGLWERFNNADFKVAEFDHFKNQAGSNSFVLSPTQWIEKTNAIGITSKSGRYGGTYAHKDIAFEFASWISQEFKFYLIKEFQRLKEVESNEHNLDWNVKRLISKTNYKLHTEAVKNYVIPQSILPLAKQGIEYANEAEVLNMAVFGCTSKQWKQQNPQAVLNNENIRDIASINELAVLSTLEAMNSHMIKQGADRQKRLNALRDMAQDQLSTLNRISDDKKSLKRINESVYIENKQATNHNPKD
ncbi:hypothetical protein SPONL_254 [uncultured Candidatus Thioglobus sp.]|nr:hypothetical protein SPONL_254 [uncultured Candidatus Thioglobus sp.]